MLGLCALLVAAGARAQGTGSLLGDVVDSETAAGVAGVTVTVSGPALQGTLVDVTDDEGRYRIDGLPVGTYAIAFAREGVTAEPILDVQIRADVTLRADAVVVRDGARPSSREVLRVVAGSPVVDVGSTQTGGTLNVDITRRVPLVAPGARGGAQRSFESAAAVLPQVQHDSFGASVNGATSVENQYLIDGLSVNNVGYGFLGAPLSLELIEQVSVITGGYLPEYGRSTGGVLHVVTKSGTNELHGSAWGNVAPGFLEGERALASTAGSAIRAEPSLDSVGDIGFDLGGPLLPDKLWFYVGVDLHRQAFRIARKLFRADGIEIEGTRQEFVAEATGLQALAKLTWLANADNRVTFTFFATPMAAGGNGKLGLDLRTGRPEVTTFEGSFPALAHITRGGAIDAIVAWRSSLLERKLRLDASVGYHREESSLQGLPSDGSQIGDKTGLASIPRVSFRRSSPGPHGIATFEVVPPDAGCDAPGTDDATLCPVATYQLGGPDFLDEQTGESFQLRQVVTGRAELFGLHVLKAGGELGYGTFDNLRAYSGGRRYREDPSGALFQDDRQLGFLTGPDEAVLLDSLRWRTGNLWLGAFVQDSWTLTDLVTFSFGLRYDGQWLFAGDGSLSLALPSQLSPRAGIIVDPFRSGRVKLYGSLARYYESVPLDIADRAGSSEPHLLSAHPADLCDPTDPEQSAPGGACVDDAHRLVQNDVDAPSQRWVVTGGGKTAVDPSLQPASSDEIVVGAEVEIFRDARVAVSYSRRSIGCPFPGAEDIGDGVLCAKAIEDMSRDEANTYFIGNPGFGIAHDFDIAQRNYDAVTLLFHKQWSDQWLAQASYTLSTLSGNTAGLFRPETEQLDPNVSSDFDLRSLTVNRDGPLPADRTHQLKVFGAREFDAAHDTRFTLGGSASALSGAPSSVLGSHPLYGSDEVFILPRGSGPRLPWTFGADLHAAFAFQPLHGQTVELSVDVLNVLNFQAASLVDETYTNADVEPLREGACDGACDEDDLARVKQTDGSALEPRAVNPGFGQPLAYQAPRTVRFGLRWSF